jgi:hypothetical protein
MHANLWKDGLNGLKAVGSLPALMTLSPMRGACRPFNSLKLMHNR